MELRKYQSEAITQLRQGLVSGHKSQCLQMATGSGKTVVAAKLAASVVAKGKRFWFVVDTLELVDQTVAVFESFGLSVGVIQGQHDKTDYRKPVQVVTAQTITKRWRVIDAHPEYRPDLVMIDEAHCIFKAHKEMFGMFKGLPFIGLSATPWAKGMGTLYSNLIVGATTKTLIEDDYLCNYEAYGCYTPDMKKVKLLGGDYKIDEMEEKLNTKEIVGDVVKTWLKLGQNRQTLAYGVNVAHSKSIADEFNAYGVKAAHVDGYTDKDERAELLQSFRDGEIQVLSSVGVLTKGVDLPTATCLIIARPTKSLMLHYQIMGRVLRISPCGKDALILDHSGNLARLGFPDDDVEKELCNGEKADSKTKKKEEIEKELAAPKPCSVCTFMFVGSKCPSCGNEYFRSPEVTALEGELEKIKRNTKTPKEIRNSETSINDKEAFLSAALAHAHNKGYREGWASNNYRDYFGVWPNKITRIQGAQSSMFSSYLTAKNIKYAKSQKPKGKPVPKGAYKALAESLRAKEQVK